MKKAGKEVNKRKKSQQNTVCKGKKRKIGIAKLTYRSEFFEK